MLDDGSSMYDTYPPMINARDMFPVTDNMSAAMAATGNMD
jgi:hypothetical protein